MTRNAEHLTIKIPQTSGVPRDRAYVNNHWIIHAKHTIRQRGCTMVRMVPSVILGTIESEIEITICSSSRLGLSLLLPRSHIYLARLCALFVMLAVFRRRMGRGIRLLVK